MSKDQLVLERNERYFKKHGYGFGTILCDDKVLETLRTLSLDQIRAIIELILHGDIWEVGGDSDLLGVYEWTPDDYSDPESEHSKALVAALVYLTGHLAEDIPELIDAGTIKNIKG